MTSPTAPTNPSKEDSTLQPNSCLHAPKAPSAPAASSCPTSSPRGRQLQRLPGKERKAIRRHCPGLIVASEQQRLKELREQQEAAERSSCPAAPESAEQEQRPQVLSPRQRCEEKDGEDVVLSPRTRKALRRVCPHALRSKRLQRRLNAAASAPSLPTLPETSRGPLRPQRSRSEGFMSSVITGAAEDWLLQEAHAKDAARRLNIADPSIPVGTASFEMRRRAQH